MSPSCPSRRIVSSCAAIVVALVGAGCSSQSTAKSYHLAKLNRDGTLMPIDALVERRSSTQTNDESAQSVEDDRFDSLIETNDCLEIRLADHFIRFLNAVGSPEVVVFTRCRIRSPDGSAPELVYDRILLNTQDQELTQSGIQGAGGSLRDVVVLPAIEYKNEDIMLSIRMIELDQDDNQRIGKLLQGASATSAQLKTAAAPELAAFQAVVSFLVANNPDDVEFALDLGLTANSSTTFRGAEDALPGVPRTATHSITPRVGMIAAIKTEGVDRFVVPQKYEQYLPQALLWTFANVGRLVTLDLFNRLPGRIDYDAYSDFFGDPLRVPSNSLIEPAFARDRLMHRINIDDLESDAGRETFVIRDRSLCTVTSVAENAVPEPFRDKSYVLLSVQSPSLGIPVKELARISDSLEDLKIRTTQLTPAEVAKVLDQIQADYLARTAKNEARQQRDERDRDVRRKRDERRKPNDPGQPDPRPRESPGNNADRPSTRLRAALQPLSIEDAEKERRVREVESIERD